MYDVVGGLGVAIIVFTIFMRTIMIPLDFGTKYFTKKNTIKMAEMKPELDRVSRMHAGDPLAKNRATQAVYKKNGHSMGGFCLFMFVNMAFMMILFITVFGSMNHISNYNINHQFKELQAIYVEFDINNGGLGHDTPEFREAILARHDETRVSFLWVNNMWRPDTWSSRTMDWGSFNSTIRQVNAAERVVTNQEQYNMIMYIVNSDSSNRGWNGLLLLVVLAGVTMYVSAVINARALQKKVDEKKAKEQEEEVKYSMRETLETQGDGSTPAMPQMNPAMMGNMMKIVLPLIMVVITFIYTAALALYIVVGAIMTTVYSLGTGALADKILKKQEERKKEESPGNIINPHAKYFKKRK